MKREKIYKIFSAMPTLRTERLILRPMKESDANDMFDYAQREDVTTYLLWSPHRSVSYTREYLKYIETRYDVGDFYDWAVIERSSGKMIGTCGFTRIDMPNNVGEIGYVLNPDFHGKGYGTEAASEALRFGFDVIGLHRIEAKFMEGNRASLHVMDKLGMSFEGFRRESMLVKGKYRTVGICALLSEDYHRYCGK
ncbi:MAG: GNAT family N-acetyltransferase [Ruminococcaceae bacterium]|nr:GNAT family N-acetyltransferase [Oscillospiraceae bacterium]